ncbi:hypothetical protein BGZ73_008229 [Actinomortierella ambigua]|nr:hypothetical protein BGZ73_008229 [Actinomortierella ambigua]
MHFLKAAILAICTVAVVGSAAPLSTQVDMSSNAGPEQDGECQPSTGKLCKKGYRCFVGPGQPPGATGICWRNDICQPSIGLSCLEGYSCEIPTGSPPGAPGKCCKIRK